MYCTLLPFCLASFLVFSLILLRNLEAIWLHLLDLKYFFMKCLSCNNSNLLSQYLLAVPTASHSTTESQLCFPVIKPFSLGSVLEHCRQPRWALQTSRLLNVIPLNVSDACLLSANLNARVHTKYFKALTVQCYINIYCKYLWVTTLCLICYWVINHHSPLSLHTWNIYLHNITL